MSIDYSCHESFLIWISALKHCIEGMEYEDGRKREREREEEEEREGNDMKRFFTRSEKKGEEKLTGLGTTSFLTTYLREDDLTIEEAT